MSNEKSFSVDRRKFLVATTAGLFEIENGKPNHKTKDKNPESPEKKRKLITEQELGEFVKEKRIVIFGGLHDIDYTKDSEIFIRLIPQLKANGFTHVAMELDNEWHQQAIDQYLQDGNDSGLKKTLSRYIGGSPKELAIIHALRTAGIKIICYDDRNRKNYPGIITPTGEETSQWWNERENHGFRNIDNVLSNDKGIKIAIYTNISHAKNAPEMFQYGQQKDGMPKMITLQQPLGYKFKQKYENYGGVGIIDLSESRIVEIF